MVQYLDTYCHQPVLGTSGSTHRVEFCRREEVQMLIDQARLMEDLAGVVRKQPILFSKQLQQRQRADGVHIFFL
jgi:hypothetical protein